jgi:hypothetical protein
MMDGIKEDVAREEIARNAQEAADRLTHGLAMQCAACGRWMRLHGKRLEVVDGEITEVAVQRFYGGCDYNNGGDHLAATKDNSDVCNRRCQIECKAIAEKAA